MKSLLLSLIAIFFFCGVNAQSFKNEFGFKTENDAYLATLNDRYYTNGLFIYFRRALNPNNLSENVEKKTYQKISMHIPKESIEKEKLLSLSVSFSIQCNIDKLNLNECA